LLCTQSRLRYTHIDYYSRHIRNFVHRASRVIHSKRYRYKRLDLRLHPSSLRRARLHHLGNIPDNLRNVRKLNSHHRCSVWLLGQREPSLWITPFGSFLQCCQPDKRYCPSNSSDRIAIMHIDFPRNVHDHDHRHKWNTDSFCHCNSSLHRLHNHIIAHHCKRSTWRQWDCDHQPCKPQWAQRDHLIVHQPIRLRDTFSRWFRIRILSQHVKQPVFCCTLNKKPGRSNHGLRKLTNDTYKRLFHCGQLRSQLEFSNTHAANLPISLARNFRTRVLGCRPGTFII